MTVEHLAQDGQSRHTLLVPSPNLFLTPIVRESEFSLLAWVTVDETDLVGLLFDLHCSVSTDIVLLGNTSERHALLRVMKLR